MTYMKRTIRTAELEAPLPYHFLTSLVVPRPIAWVGSRAEDGTRNLAPFSFFNVVSSDPPMVMFCPVGHPLVRKDTLANVRETGEFTVSLVTEAVAPLMNVTSGTFHAGEDEFAEAGLTPINGSFVNAPFVGESPVALECVVRDIHEVGNGRIVVGEVVAFHIDDSLFDGDRIQSSVIGVVARMGGGEYARTDDPFSMVRPD
jgi:flavin reductase (DIM6/NTAB) family NADH-FMN oxidoreductase RutF